MYKADLLAFCWVHPKSSVPLLSTSPEALRVPSQPAMSCADDILSAAELVFCSYCPFFNWIADFSGQLLHVALWN